MNFPTQRTWHRAMPLVKNSSQEASMAKLPIYVLIDSTEVMLGDPQRASQLQRIINDTFAQWWKDPNAYEMLWISVCTVDAEFHIVSPLTQFGEFRPPPIRNSHSRCMRLGRAFHEISENIRNDCDLSSDWPPLVISLIAATPSERWQDDAVDLLNVIKSNDFFVCSFRTLYLFTTESLRQDFATVIPNTCLLDEASETIRGAYRGYFVDPPERKRRPSLPDAPVDLPPLPPGFTTMP
jgi:uncharacterized protein YegL